MTLKAPQTLMSTLLGHDLGAVGEKLYKEDLQNIKWNHSVKYKSFPK